jgi:hypothetical protein
MIASFGNRTVVVGVVVGLVVDFTVAGAVVEPGTTAADPFD